MDTKETAVLRARIEDAIRQCENKSVPKYVGFLDAKGQAISESVAKTVSLKTLMYGGYDEAERACFGVFPNWCEAETSGFPIVKLKIANKSSKAFTHRDILGALMSAGIERDTIGDILVGTPDSIVFVIDTVAEHIISEVSKIASCGIVITRDESDYLPQSAGFTDGFGTVASERLDCVIALLAGCSRNRACELIESGNIAVNGLEVLKVTATVNQNDKISIRRMGKFIVDEISSLTKKGRIVLKYRKYI